jgi:hypothetical protein
MKKAALATWIPIIVGVVLIAAAQDQTIPRTIGLVTWGGGVVMQFVIGAFYLARLLRSRTEYN